MMPTDNRLLSWYSTLSNLFLGREVSSILRCDALARAASVSLIVSRAASSTGLFLVRSCLGVKLDAGYPCSENNGHHGEDPACQICPLPKDRRPMALPYARERRLQSFGL
jgi:hypothetical protein